MIRLLVDLDSRGKTFLDLKELEAHVPSVLKPNSMINFACSTRKYTLTIDYSYV
jgi:hypothetical protein